MTLIGPLIDLPCLIRRCRFSVGKSVGRMARFVDELEPFVSNCTERSIMIFLQMSLLEKNEHCSGLETQFA